MTEALRNVVQVAVASHAVLAGCTARVVSKCVPPQGRNGQQQNGDEAERAKIHWMVNRLIIVGT